MLPVYTYLHTMNGRVLRERWGKDALLGSWFRKEHPGKAFPSWVAAELARDADEDPGHESEWNDLENSVKSGKLKIDVSPLYWIGVIVHLLPLTEIADLSEPESEGWFAEDAGLRRPARFPLGISTEIDDHETHSWLDKILAKSV